MQSIRLVEGWEHYRGSLGGVWEVWREAKLKSSLYHLPWEAVSLPHCFNRYDAVDPDVKYYQGQGWYRTSLGISNPYKEGRTLLRFEGAGQKSTVYVATGETGRHNGGFDEFRLDITEAAEAAKGDPLYKGKVPVAVMTDNSRDLETIPSDISDFNVYGGLYRHVHLVYVPKISLERVHATVLCVSGDKATIQLKARLYNPQRASDTVKLTVTVRDPAGKEIFRRETSAAPWEGLTELDRLELDALALWSPDHPQLYTCEVELESVHGATKQTVRFGVRTYEFVEKGPFLLNGKRLLIRGTHRHDDHAGVGAAMTDDMIRTELRLVKEMGANFLRLGHYQQSELVLELCDELGLLVWEEIPWCRGGLGGDGYKRQCREMLEAMIDQHYNHPSVIIWGLGNENDWEADFDSFDKDAIRAFMKELHDLSHELDPYRLTGIRRCDFCKDIVDVYSPSIWAGWYRGIYPKYEEYSRHGFEQTSRFLHLEWGADAMAGRHVEQPYTGFRDIRAGTSAEERDGDFLMSGGEPRVSALGDWSETYFCDLIDWHLKSQETMDWLTGTAQWVFKDFSTPVRPDNPVPYVNQKGVIERDFTKKDAYYVFQSYWSEQPMVRIYGHSWRTRWGRPSEKKLIRVYSNCLEAELFANGISCGRQRRDPQNFPCAGLRWEIELAEGFNHLKVVASKDGVTVEDETHYEYQTSSWSEPAYLRMTATKQTDSLVSLEVKAYDRNHVFCPDAVNFIRFSLAGDGKLIDNLGTARASRYVQLAGGRATICAEYAAEGTLIASAASDGLKTAIVVV
ncbi:glycoside hydrolase family 2 TIM barrel-domain containing protein [Paenibacillus ginsengarvi]|uniref:Glycoside hydrolase family 2 protein n=1 Tax=Paenibacillus ginsengarvi TaxID=400777 RepID=A0A3B0CCR5_9BACL|nr:glycoside hydrolase family 2 TIM barrel-domain containing protein [Paenibacillus ginsengarvi]RKN84085.1 glycoside hydrolase family 2 protein [Paenibacillus ginsengarvi]